MSLLKREDHTPVVQMAPEKEQQLRPEEQDKAKKAEATDLDKLDVTELQKKVLDALEREAKRLEATNQKDAAKVLRQVGASYKKFTDGFNPARDEESEDYQAYVALGEIPPGVDFGGDDEAQERYLAQRRYEQTLINNEFREEFKEIAAFIEHKLTRKDEGNNEVMMAATVELIVSIYSKGDDVEFKKGSGAARTPRRDEFVAAYVSALPNDPKAREKAEELFNAIIDVGHAGPVPFHEFAEQFEEPGVDVEDAVNELALRREMRFERLVAAFDEFLPESLPGEHRFDHKRETPQHGYKKEAWEQQVKANGGYTINLTEKIVENGRLQGEHVHKTRHLVETKKSDVRVERPDGMVQSRQVDQASYTLYMDVYKSELQGKQAGEAVGNDYIVHVEAYSFTATNIVRTKEELDRWGTYAVAVDGGRSYKIPVMVTDLNGNAKESWLIVSADVRSQVVGSLDKSQKSFEGLGFKYEAEKKKQLEREGKNFDYLEEHSPRYNSSIEYERAHNAIRDRMLEEIAAAREDPERQHLVPLLEQSMERVSYMYEDFSINFGKRSRYEMLARQRLEKRGISPDDENWDAQLQQEVGLMEEYYNQKAIALKKTAASIEDQANLVTVLPADANLDDAQREAAVSARERELQNRMCNLDYEIEEHFLALIMYAEGNGTVTADEARARVATMLAQVRRTDVGSPEAVQAARSVLETQRAELLERLDTFITRMRSPEVGAEVTAEFQEIVAQARQQLLDSGKATPENVDFPIDQVKSGLYDDVDNFNESLPVMRTQMERTANEPPGAIPPELADTLNMLERLRVGYNDTVSPEEREWFANNVQRQNIVRISDNMLAASAELAEIEKIDAPDADGKTHIFEGARKVAKQFPPTP